MSTRAFNFFAAALSAVFVFFGSAVSTAVAAEPEVVRLGWFGGPRIWTICKATNMFDKGMGTKVEWVQFPSGAAALTSLAAKQVDISRLGSTPTVAAIARKLPIEVFRYRRNHPDQRTVHREESDHQRRRAQRQAHRLSARLDRALRADGGAEGQQHRSEGCHAG